MTTSLLLRQLQAFTSGVPTQPNLSHLQLHLLRGWQDSTLRSYNGAVKKFLVFWNESNDSPFCLPAAPNVIYQFCWWTGRNEFLATDHDISSKTLKNYLSGLQAWHLLHDLPYPHVTSARVKVFLRASARADALLPQKPPKPPVLIEHVVALYTKLVDGSEVDKAVLDCALCAFWGLARLWELTYDKRAGRVAWINSVLSSDVAESTTKQGSLGLMVRGAKTAKAGQAQRILLNAQRNMLCPVRAVRRRQRACLEPSDLLFGYWHDKSRVNLTRNMVIRRCKQVWDAEGWTTLSGHSFRVGGDTTRRYPGLRSLNLEMLLNLHSRIQRG